MVLFGPPNIDKLKADGNIKGLINALYYQKDKSIPVLATEVLIEIGEPAVIPLINALNRPLVGAVQRQENYLSTTMKQNIYWVSIIPLARIGEPAVIPLIDALNCLDDYTQGGAALTLGSMGEKRAIEPLIALLSDYNENVQRWASQALAMIGEPAIEFLVSELSNEKRGLTAAFTLAAIGKRGIDSLIDALKNKDKVVRGNVVTCIFVSKPWISDARVCDLLIKLLSAPDVDERRMAANALGSIGDKKAIEPLNKAAHEDWGGRSIYYSAVKKIDNRWLFAESNE